MLGACVAGYFVYHAVQGDRGIVAWMQLNQQIRVAETEFAKTDAERQEMEQRVALLSNTSLDLDMLEERAQVMLNFAHPDDLVIFLDRTPAPTPAAPAKPAQKPIIN